MKMRREKSDSAEMLVKMNRLAKDMAEDLADLKMLMQEGFRKNRLDLRLLRDLLDKEFVAVDLIEYVIISLVLTGSRD